MTWFHKRKPSPAEVIRDLREQAFTVAVAEGQPRSVVVLLMETAYPKAVATLACFADGTTSLYFSTGGGMLGAGQHESVRAAASAFLATATRDAALLVEANEHPLPEAGHVRFHARIGATLLGGDALEQDLIAHSHPLSPLFYAGQAVITAIRETGASQ
ncbi:MAG TPA: hypothetical protein VF929_02420 [Gemmatimonadaceae bacterium]